MVNLFCWPNRPVLGKSKFKWYNKSGEFQVRLTGINFVLYTALPDEVLVEVFKNFCLKEILKTLCLVSRRWRHIVNDNNILWSCFPLDEWHIRYLSEENFINIMSHSSGFRYFSIRYIEMRTSERRLETLLENRLGFSKHLRYLDLSGQPISSLNFLLTESFPLETLILNDCHKINACRCTAVLMQIKNLRILSLNRVGFTANQVATITAFSCSLNVLCLVGVSLRRKDKTDFAKIESPSVFRNILQFWRWRTYSCSRGRIWR